MRRECGELALQLVQAAQLSVLDRPLEEGGDQRAERGQEVDLRRVEREVRAALVARQEAETASLADERHDHERPDPEPARDLLGDRVLAVRILDEHRTARRERILERAELRDWERRRKRAELGRR